MTLSFIIPVYNGHEYIIRCLDSICALDILQQDYEIIVVDDCSTDDTREIVNDYITSHPQVRLLCQLQNHRQGAARNIGLQDAKGEYILFVDGDDYLLPDFVAAYKLALQTKADMVYFGLELEKTSTEIYHLDINFPKGNIMAGVAYCEQYYNEGVFWYPWSYIIRKDYLVFLNYPFVEDRQHEDRDWLAYVLSQAESVTYSPQYAYRYCCNPNSTCRAPKYSTLFDHVASGIRHIDLAKKLAEQCPNLSQLLYSFGVDEIYKSVRLRNLTKYSWKENRHLYDEQHLQPLIPDLKRLCKEYTLPFAVHHIIYGRIWLMPLLLIASPIAATIRKLKH